jgi:site-specific DNA recombinase
MTPAAPLVSSGAGIAAIYCRISEDRGGSGMGLARQEADCRSIVDRRCYPPDRVRIYRDDDISAYSGKRRPDYERLLADIEAGDIALVVTWHPDRLHRSPIELERFISIVEEAGVDIETVRSGVLNLSTPTGRMTARITGAVARHESEHKSDRIRRKARELAENGKVSGGGTRPFGFNDDRRSIREDEAQIIREAAARVLSGEALRSVCRDLIARGVNTVTGVPWSAQVLRGLLRSARNSGRREHNGVIVADAEWPAIISATESDRLRRLLNDSGRRTTWTSRSYLLREVATCALCGRRLRARPASLGRRCYVCASGPPHHGCGKIRIDAESLEVDVVERIFAAVDDGELDRILSAGDGDPSADALTEIGRLDAELEALAAQFAEGDLTRSEWSVMRPIFLDRRARAEQRYDELRGRESLRRLRRPLRAAWAVFTFSQRRGTVSDLLVEVRVAPAIRGLNRYDPNRVSIAWKV